MKILVIGGTGAMGIPLVNILAEKGHEIYVTSRSDRKSRSNIHYIKGNGLDSRFIRELIGRQSYDVIVDFMVRSQGNLKNLLDNFLSNTSQYIFISSARVYAESDAPISEDTPRLLDVSDDKKFLRTNEYALAKAREENILFNSGKTNFTIIRPSITYNDYRLQLGVFEKEEWLFRALKGRTIVFSKDLKDKQTTLTHGDDVARGIAAVMGQQDALGKVFHITSPISMTWEEILKIYVDTIEKKIGKTINIYYTDKSTNFNFPEKKYQLIYCRYFNRRFNNSRINNFIDVKSFKSPEVGLKDCVNNFISSPKFNSINGALEAIHDSLTDDITPINELSTSYSKLSYFLQKKHLGWTLQPLRKIVKLIKKLK